MKINFFSRCMAAVVVVVASSLNIPVAVVESFGRVADSMHSRRHSYLSWAAKAASAKAYSACWTSIVSASACPPASPALPIFLCGSSTPSPTAFSVA